MMFRHHQYNNPAAFAVVGTQAENMNSEQL